MRRIFVLLLALGLALVACGGGGGTAPSQPAAKPAEPAKPTAAPPAAQPPSAAQPAAQPSPAQSAPQPAAKPAEPAKPTATDKPAAPAPAAAQPSGQKQQLKFYTSSAASSIYTYAVAMSKVMNGKVPEVNVTVVESGAAIENHRRLANQEGDLGISAADSLYRAINGLAEFKDKPIKDQRFLWSHSLLPIMLLVREDSNVKKIEDLNNKDFNPGIRGSNTEANVKQILEANGVKAKYYVGSTEDAVGAIKDRRIVGFGKTSAGPRGADAAILDLMTSAPLFAIRLTEGQMKKAEQEFPWLSRGQVEAGVYKADWNKEAYRTFQQLAGVVATTRMSTDVAYKLVKAIIEDNKPGGEGVQALAFPSIKGIDLAEQSLNGLNVPLHAGAEKYYREIGLKIPDLAKSPES
ncbi:MAG: TAXI family TRAP transporter solute-binding subunit [Chloroflexi bacterium]|nr:TAXI family TRAP transporter solute-binding subunit [Chloroflexota bacterium]